MARKILLADDSVTAQNMGRKILTDAGYEVVTVNNGSAALKKIFEAKPDLVVLDVYMPGYSGLEVCQRIKENKDSSRIPILLTVGKLEPFKPEEARRVRADAFVVKPFEASELLAALARLEDKIVPQPEPYKPGRFAKAVAAVDEIAGVDKDESWKARLRIPVPGAKDTEAQPEPEVTTSAKTFRDVSTEDSGQRAKEPKREPVFAPPLPSGLPVDITPEEIAAITAAAEQLKGSTPSLSSVTTTRPIPTSLETISTPAAAPAEEASPVTFASAPEAPMPSDGVSLAGGGVETFPQEAASAVSTPSGQSVVADTPSDVSASPEAAQAQDATPEPAAVVPDTPQEATPSTPPEIAAAPPAAAAESIPPQKSEVEPSMPSPAPLAEPAPPVADDEVMAALQSLMPVGVHDEPAKPGPDVPVQSDAIPALAEIVATVDSASVKAHVAGPRWVAEEIALAQDEVSLSLEREMEQAYAVAAASREVRAVSAVSVAERTEAPASAAPESAVSASVSASEVHSAESPAAAYAMAASAPEAAISASSSVVMPHPETRPPHDAEISGTADIDGPINHLAQPVAEEPRFTPSADSPNSLDIDTSGGVEDMAASWKNIRDSIATGGAAKAAPAKEKEELRPTETAPEEPAAAPASLSSAHSSASDPKAIASIVDSVLAELRPKIVEEIAKKLADSKKD